MSSKPYFVSVEELVLMVPIHEPVTGERIELERWPFDQVVEELERLAEAACGGEPRAQRVYQRLVYSLRRAKIERQLQGEAQAFVEGATVGVQAEEQAEERVDG